MTHENAALLPALQLTVEKRMGEFHQIVPARKKLLEELTTFIQTRTNKNLSVNLNFICTHNSRRSHIAQLWAQAAAHVYRVPHVLCCSGGTEATAFNPRAVKAMRGAGFSVVQTTAGENPHYEVCFSKNSKPIIVFSKRFDDPSNNCPEFAAVMTCSQADENCPLVPGAIARIALTYDDPKEFDGTLLEESKYAERVQEIGREILYAFSQVRE